MHKTARDRSGNGHARSPVALSQRPTEVPDTGPLVSPTQSSQFPPIADYAFLSDCEVNALVAPDGNVEWLCLPRHDSPSVFASLLDRDGGRFRIGPISLAVPTRRSYVPGSLVLETVWQTATGWVVVRDALCMTPWRHHEERAERFRRSPPEWEAAGMLVRTIECTYGHVEMELIFSPVFEYGSKAPTLAYAGPGYSEIDATAEDSAQRLVLTSDMRLGLEPFGARARTFLEKGQRAFAVISWGDAPAPRTVDEATARIDETNVHWQRWLDRGSFPDHPWKEYLQRSALIVKGLTYAPTGALIAAATTSLPETPGGARNWDYRYSWLRDSTYTVALLTRFGYEVEARDFTLFLYETVKPADGLQIMYGIDGATKLDEHQLDHLGGYEGARPVRIGNGAYSQKQHDTWGNLIGLIAVQARNEGHVPGPVWRAVQKIMADMSAHWRDPDHGIWEMRGEPQHFVSSKLMCWFAAHASAQLALLRRDQRLADEWSALAAEIKAEICTKGVDERGVFTQYYGSKSLDASCLGIALLQFLPPDDERLRATVLAIADELTIDGLVLRYRVEQTDDGLEGEEGTFCICSFWLVSALVYIGELPRARRLAEKLLAFASPLGLYAEEIDVATARHLGNFPQAFSHLSLASALLKVIDAEAEQAALQLRTPRRSGIPSTTRTPLAHSGRRHRGPRKEESRPVARRALRAR
jgi:GH15 family glucan-1,4-alpha-glucosidase